MPIGAQSSLTGGATPMGDTLLSTSRLNRVLDAGDDWIRVEAGVTLMIRRRARVERQILSAGTDLHGRLRYSQAAGAWK